MGTLEALSNMVFFFLAQNMKCLKGGYFKEETYCKYSAGLKSCVVGEENLV